MRIKYLLEFLWNSFWCLYSIYWFDKGLSWWWLLLIPVFIGASLQAGECWNKMWETK